jgi:hypothetical protein
MTDSFLPADGRQSLGLQRAVGLHARDRNVSRQGGNHFHGIGETAYHSSASVSITPKRRSVEARKSFIPTER